MEKTLREHLQSIAKKGGEMLVKKRGSQHMSEISKKGWKKRKSKSIN